MSASQPPVPPNPYAPPGADLEARPAPVAANALSPASRGARLGAAFVDGLLMLLTQVPVYATAWGTPAMRRAYPFNLVGRSPAQVVSTIAWAALHLLQAYLIATTGQSIGKRLLGIRIVLFDGRPPGFVRGVLLRNWILIALSWVPALKYPMAAFDLVDVLFIFREDRRCLHDLIAGTGVAEGPPA